MILVTGAAGQTGRAVIRALAAKDLPVRALVHRAEQAEQLRELGASEVVSGDMLSRSGMEKAAAGVNAVCFISSAENPAEYEMGRVARGQGLRSGPFCLSLGAAFASSGASAPRPEK